MLLQSVRVDKLQKECFWKAKLHVHIMYFGNINVGEFLYRLKETMDVLSLIAVQNMNKP